MIWNVKSLEPGFQLFRQQLATEYNRLARQGSSKRNTVIRRARHVIRQVDTYANLPDLSEAERFWLEVIRESFDELMERASRR